MATQHVAKVRLYAIFQGTDGHNKAMTRRVSLGKIAPSVVSTIPVPKPPTSITGWNKALRILPALGLCVDIPILNSRWIECQDIREIKE